MTTAADMGEKIFSAQGLAKVYTTGEVEVRALRDLNLEVSAGEVVVLLGPSGSHRGAAECQCAARDPTPIITHNASIQDVADRILFFAGSRVHKNLTRRVAGGLSW